MSGAASEPGETPIGDISRQIERRARFRQSITRIAPKTAPWFRTHLARLLAASQIGQPVDGLLIIADSLEEAAMAAISGGEIELAAQLHRLANLPRDTARCFAVLNGLAKGAPR